MGDRTLLWLWSTRNTVTYPTRNTIFMQLLEHVEKICAHTVKYFNMCTKARITSPTPVSQETLVLMCRIHSEKWTFLTLPEPTKSDTAKNTLGKDNSLEFGVNLSNLIINLIYTLFCFFSNQSFVYPFLTLSSNSQLQIVFIS